MRPANRRASLAVGALALVAGALLALLGRAVLDVQGSVQRSLVTWPSGAQAGDRGEPAFSGFARTLVGAGGAERFAAAVATYRHATRPPVFDVPPETLASELRAVRRLPTPQARARGLVMLGHLFVLATGSDGRILGGPAARRDGANLLNEARDEFRTATFADPTYADAKYDLELLLRLQIASQPPHPRRRSRKPGKHKATSRRQRAQGRALNRTEVNHAGVYVAGSGY